MENRLKWLSRSMREPEEKTMNRKKKTIRSAGGQRRWRRTIEEVVVGNHLRATDLCEGKRRSYIDNGMLPTGGGETYWNNWVPIKLNIFIWRLRLNSLPTRANLSYRGILLDSILCPVCSAMIESIDHLFFGYSELIDLWNRVALWWGVHVPQHLSIDSLLFWSNSFSWRSGQRKVFDAVIMTTLWCIWNFRNSILFGTELPMKSIIFDEMVKNSYFWVVNRCSKANIGWTNWLHNLVSACKLL
ncbi:hypothetical protein Lser_V15G40076 [Lactuca serriola]